jgi:hypothetical protein
MEGVHVPMSHGRMEDIAEEVETSVNQSDTGESTTSQDVRHIFQREAHIVVDYSLLDDNYKDVMCCLFSLFDQFGTLCKTRNTAIAINFTHCDNVRTGAHYFFKPCNKFSMIF